MAVGFRHGADIEAGGVECQGRITAVALVASVGTVVDQRLLIAELRGTAAHAAVPGKVRSVCELSRTIAERQASSQTLIFAGRDCFLPLRADRSGKQSDFVCFAGPDGGVGK